MYFTNCLHLLWFLELCTYQENGQLEFIIEHHGVNTAGSVEPGCDFIHEVSVEDEEDNAHAWSRRDGRREGLGEYFRENPATFKNLMNLLNCFCFTFCLRLWLETELQGEIGSLAEPVASEREDGLQQRQAGLKVGSNNFLHNAGQSEWDKHSGCRKMSRWEARPAAWGGGVSVHTHMLRWSLTRSYTSRLLLSFAKYMAVFLCLDRMLQSAPYSSRRRTTSAFPLLHACWKGEKTLEQGNLCATCKNGKK